MRIDRIWAMPNRWTFLIPPIAALLEEEMTPGIWADPMSGRHSPAQLTNDLDPLSPASSHLDALEFLRGLGSASVDGVLYDPPYSLRQVSECYRGFGIEGFDGRMNWNSRHKDEMARIIRPGGKAICFGWNSMGLGLTRGFDMTRILLVPHGGDRHDTIVTVETRRS